jgi:hypothetical protein
MTITDIAPGPSPFSTNPDFARGRADAYDDAQRHHAASVQVNAQLALDFITPASTIQERMYAAGYGHSALENMRSHLAAEAVRTAQIEEAQTWLARKQGRQTSTLHTRRHTKR